MFLSETMQQKWAPVLDHPDLPAIKDSYKKSVTAVLLENQEKAIAEDGTAGMLLEAGPANASADMGATGMKGYDPVLISLVRRAMPQLIAYDVCGVQPMTGPTGLIFAMKSRYSGENVGQGGSEALFDEANTSFGGSADIEDAATAVNADQQITSGVSSGTATFTLS